MIANESTEPTRAHNSNFHAPQFAIPRRVVLEDMITNMRIFAKVVQHTERYAFELLKGSTSDVRLFQPCVPPGLQGAGTCLALWPAGNCHLARLAAHSPTLVGLSIPTVTKYIGHEPAIRDKRV
jgi:hypothetical protein